MKILKYRDLFAAKIRCVLFGPAGAMDAFVCFLICFALPGQVLLHSNSVCYAVFRQPDLLASWVVMRKGLQWKSFFSLRMSEGKKDWNEKPASHEANERLKFRGEFCFMGGTPKYLNSQSTRVLLKPPCPPFFLCTSVL
jgi:hypothetical protein